MDFGKLTKELEQAERALKRLDGILTTVEFDPDEPASIQVAINRMEVEVDSCVSSYRRNPLVSQLTDSIKENLADQIRERAARERSENAAKEKEPTPMDNTIFRQLENIVNDLKWSDMNTFARHIKKLSKLLVNEELQEISNQLTELVDLEAWLEEGLKTQGGMVGSASLEWPVEPREELGMTIALIHRFAENPKHALSFCHTFYYIGSKITPELQGMVAQVIVPFARDYIDYVKAQTGIEEATSIPIHADSTSRKVFVVHGHDEAAKEAVARFLERLDFEAIILHEQASKGRTVIEKIEAHGDVGFAVVLLTPDDIGGLAGASTQARARQNVILELGYFLGRLGRSRVSAFRKGDVEVPSDFGGVVYENFDRSGAWKQALGKELAAAGFDIDWDKIMK